jgi:hypothetical protein
MVVPQESGVDMSMPWTGGHRLPQAAAQRLQQLGQRRLSLVLVRSVSIFLAIACLLLLAASLIDFWMPLSQSGRRQISGWVYALLATAAVGAIAPVFRRWSWVDSANAVEAKVPALKNRVLSAVELSVDSDDPRYGSRELRDHLLQSVSQQLQEVSPASVFPWKQIARWLYACLAALALFGMLCAIPSLQLPQHLLRVLLPAANLARPSLATLEILLPQPSSGVVAIDELLPVEVELTMPLDSAESIPESIMLEWKSVGQTPEQGTLTLPLSDPQQIETSDPAGKLQHRYAALWRIDRPSVTYRLVASVAETPWHSLQAYPRPKIEQYEIDVTPPDYARTTLPPVIAPHADVDTVIGSKIAWTLSSNRPLASASVRWIDTEIPSNPIAMEKDEQGRWKLETEATENRRFQFDLIGEEGLASTFPPTYRLTAREDRPPVPAWVVQPMRSRTVRPHSAHAMNASLVDEYVVDQMEQWTRVNRGPWTKRPVTLDPRMNQQISWDWSLDEVSHQPGDLIEIQLVAVDRKQQTGTSSILEWVVSDAILDSTVSMPTQVRQSIAQQLQNLAREAQQLHEDRKAATDGWNSDPKLPENRDQLAGQLLADARKLSERIEQTRQSVIEAIQQVEDPLSAYELRLAAESLARFQAEETRAMEQAQEAIDQAVPLAGEDPKAPMQRALAAADQARQGLQRIEQQYRKLIGHDTLSELSRQLDAARRFQDSLLADSEPVGSALWQKEQQLMVDHMQQLSKQIEQQASFLPDGPANQLRTWGEWAQQWSERVDDLLQREAPKDKNEEAELRKDFAQRLRELEDRQMVAQLHGSLPQESLQARRDLRDAAGSAADAIQRANEQWRQKRPQQADPTEVPDATSDAIDQLMERRDAMLAKPQQTGMLAADLGTAYRAIQAALEEHQGDLEASDRAVQQIAANLRTLEADQRLQEALDGVEQLLQTERFAPASVEARSENPRQWDDVGQAIEQSSQAIRQAGLPAEVADAVQALRWSPESQQIDQKIGRRRWDRENPTTAAGDLEILRDQLAQQSAKIQNRIEQARSQLQQAAPTIPDLARSAAQLAQDRAEQAEEAFQEAKRGESTAKAQQLASQRPSAAGNQAPEAQLDSALVDLAVSQDLIAPPSRSLARDADLSRQLALAAGQQVEESADQLAQSDSLTDPQPLQKWQEANQRAQETFEAIAEHFDRDLLAQRSTQKSDLESLADRLPSEQRDAIDEAYQKAQQLSDLAEADPRALLKRLEEELKQNQPMREALDDIARDLAQQSQQSLEFAAQREKAMRAAIEQSDPRAEAKRNQLQQELAFQADQAARVAQRLAQEAASQAASAGQANRQQQLQQEAKNIQKAIDQARQVGGGDPIESLVQAAQQLSQSLEQAQPSLQDAQQGLANAAQEKKFEDDKQRQQAKANLERSQNQWRDQDVRQADQSIKQREQQVRQAQSRLEQNQRTAQQAQQRRDQAKQQADKTPDNPSLQQQLQQAEAQLQLAQAVAQQAESIKQQEDNRLQQTRQQREQVGQPSQPLDSPNPSSELASRLTQQAAMRASQIAGTLKELLQDNGWTGQWQASQSQLAASANQQQAVQRSVADAARDLDRAAAHQKRLEQQATADALQQQAQAVGTTAQQQPLQAQQQLQQAAQSAEAQSPAARASAPTSQNAQQSLAQSQQAIQQRADALEQWLDQQANQQAAQQAALQEKAAQEAAQNAAQKEAAETNGDAASDPSASSNESSQSTEPTKGDPQSTSGEASNSSQSTASKASNPSSANQSDSSQSGESPTQSPLLTPQEMAQLVDQLDRQLRTPEGSVPSASPRSNSASMPSREALQRAAQQLAQSLQQQRSAQQDSQNTSLAARPLNNQGKPTQNTTATSSSQTSSSGPQQEGSGPGRTLAADPLEGVPLGNWSRLREKKAAEVVESQREMVSPKYRRQIERYFRSLSDRDGEEKR